MEKREETVYVYTNIRYMYTLVTYLMYHIYHLFHCLNAVRERERERE